MGGFKSGTELWRATVLPIKSPNTPVQNGVWPAETNSAGKELSEDQVSLNAAQFLQLRCNPGFDGFFGLKRNKTKRKSAFLWKIICNPGFCQAVYCMASQTFSTHLEGGQAMWQGKEGYKISTYTWLLYHRKGITLFHPIQEWGIVMKIPNVIFQGFSKCVV